MPADKPTELSLLNKGFEPQGLFGTGCGVVLCVVCVVCVVCVGVHLKVDRQTNKPNPILNS